MRYTMPYYYNAFKCVADKCPDTCCAGWAIVIDNITMRKYKKLPHRDKKYIMQHVDKKESIFKQNGCRCSFLNDSNLCDLIINVGEDALCKTCDRYPRHFEEYGNLVEAALSMSCPIAAGMMMDSRNSWKLMIRNDDKVSPHKDEVDGKLVTVLCKVRNKIFDYIKENDKEIYSSMKMLLCYGEQIQQYLYEYQDIAVDDEGNWIDPGIKGEKILASISEIKIRNQSLEFAADATSRQSTFRKISDILLGLEQINSDWNDYISGVKEHLYKELSEYDYNTLFVEFRKYMNNKNIEQRNIFLYYLYTYFLGAVYDFNALGMIKFAVISLYIVEELEFDLWLRNDKKISFEERVVISYKYSRQVEHSDNNLMALEGLLTAHPVFGLDNMIGL